MVYKNFYVLTTSSPDENLRVTQQRLGLTTLILLNLLWWHYCTESDVTNQMLYLESIKTVFFNFRKNTKFCILTVLIFAKMFQPFNFHKLLCIIHFTLSVFAIIWENNSHFCKNIYFFKPPCAFATILLISSWKLLRKQIF